MTLTRLVKQLPDWTVLWVSRDNLQLTRRYCDRSGIPIGDVVADPTHKTYVQLGLELVPSMAVVSADGVVEKVWRGRLHPDLLREIQAYFPVSVARNGLPRQLARPEREVSLLVMRPLSDERRYCLRAAQ